MRLAVVGDPLTLTRSPELHRAGLLAMGLEGDSRALRTPPGELAARVAQFEGEHVSGFNVTHPLKEAVMSHLTRISADAERARSVNTVTRMESGWWGESTDGPGFLDWLAHLGRDPVGARVLLWGAGGAARSIALALARVGAEPARVVVRDADNARRRDAWRELEPMRVELAAGAAEQRALAEWATVVVNATPLAGKEGPRHPHELPGESLVLDLVYGESVTDWVRAARARGLEAHDGLGLLVFQARRSLSRWFDRDVPLAPLLAAVGGLS